MTVKQLKEEREERKNRSEKPEVKGQRGVQDNEDRGHKQTAAQWEITAETLNRESVSQQFQSNYTFIEM